MKKILLMALIASCNMTHAQKKSGTITYTTTIDLSKSSGNSEIPEEIAKLLPKSIETRSALYFDNDEAYYISKLPEQKKQEKKYQESNTTVMISSSDESGKEELYMDLKKKTTVAQKSIMDKEFLVTQNQVFDKWKPSGRQKKILNYKCTEVLNINGGDTIKAWYTNEIPVSASSLGITNLPGIVLELEMQGGYKIVATDVSALTEAHKKIIKAPQKGKKVTNEQFEKIAKEKYSEIMKGNGGKNTKIIYKQM
jgi:GLPGLI family protein